MPDDLRPPLNDRGQVDAGALARVQGRLAAEQRSQGPGFFSSVGWVLPPPPASPDDVGPVTIQGANWTFANSTTTYDNTDTINWGAPASPGTGTGPVININQATTLQAQAPGVLVLGGPTLSGQLYETQPAAITIGGNTNNLAPATWGPLLPLNVTGAYNLTGLTPPATLPAGQSLVTTLLNTGTGTLTITNNDSSSTSGSRFTFPGGGSYSLPPGGALPIVLVGGSPNFWYPSAPALFASGVTAGTYGDSTHVAQVTVGTDGRITAASNVALAGGTVTSFSAGALSPLFTSSVATATTTPALTFSLSTAAANAVLAGPTSGAAAAPTYRALVDADLTGASVMTWVKVTKAYTDFSAAASTKTITIFTLAAKQVLHAIRLRHTAAFTGGTLANYTMGLSVASDTWATNVVVHGAPPAGDTGVGMAPGNANTEICPQGSPILYSASSTQAVSALATATGDTLDHATAGSVDFFLLVSTSP